MKNVFVIQSTADRDGYQYISRAVVRAGGTPIRTDDLVATGSQMEAVYKSIETADLVICDVSHFTDQVMYQLGYVQGLGRPVIIISSELSAIPFDLRGVRIFQYDSYFQFEGQFIRQLTQAVQNALENPVASSQRLHPGTNSNGVFVSYCQRDREFLDRLLVHLRPLMWEGLVDVWSDSRLLAGDNWKTEIDTALTRANIGILLISPDFLASNFIVQNELPPLLEKAKNRGMRIVPIILKPCRFIRDKQLSRFHAINDPSKPLISLSETEQEALYDLVGELVEQLVIDPAFRSIKPHT